jgi:hypothetical protein
MKSTASSRGCWRRARRDAPVLAALIAVASVVTGCGSASKPPAPVPVDAHTRAYLASVCTATIPLTRDFDGFYAALARAKQSDLTQWKQGVAAVIDKMVADASQAVRGLAGAGTPDFHGGAAVGDAVLREFTSVRTALVRAQTWAHALPTINVNQFGLAFGGMQTELLGELRNGGTTVNPLNARMAIPSLAAAQQSIPSCKPVISFARPVRRRTI